MSNNLAEATTKLLNVLSPLKAQERIRLVKGVLTLLGDDTEIEFGAEVKGKEKRDDESAKDNSLEIHQQAQSWVQKNNISREQLEHIFHIEKGDISPISLPGLLKSESSRAQNAYIIQGVVSFLKTGECKFSDEEARKLCKHFGCYNQKHHAKNLKGLKNRITGSKALGWKLTVPGLDAAAELIKQFSSND